MAKTKNTPAYVKKAIEWLENNAPEGEQIAFINEEEAAHLKAMGGSGQEVVDGVRSYEAGDGSDYDLMNDGTDLDGQQLTAKLGKKDDMYVSVIQQLIAKIETLETKVTALENA